MRAALPFKRGILNRAADGQSTVRTSGSRDLGILSSMSQTGCFLLIPIEVGNLPAGAVVGVQLLDGLNARIRGN